MTNRTKHILIMLKWIFYFLAYTLFLIFLKIKKEDILFYWFSTGYLVFFILPVVHLFLDHLDDVRNKAYGSSSFFPRAYSYHDDTDNSYNGNDMSEEEKRKEESYLAYGYDFDEIASYEETKKSQNYF